VVCANAVPTPIAEERSIALTSDFIVNSLLNDEGPTAISGEMILSCGTGRRTQQYDYSNHYNARAKQNVPHFFL
jgi:hypothetical protein